MREKILAELRKKYAGLPANILGLVAASLAKKVTEESQIEGAITELDNLPISLTDYAKFVQQEGDKRVSDALKKKGTQDPDPDDEEEDEPASPPKKGKKQAVNHLEKQIEQLTQTVQTLLNAGKQKDLSEKLYAKMKEKGIPLKMAKGVVVEKEEDLDAKLEEIEADYTEFKQELVNDGLAIQSTPASGGGPGAGNVAEKNIDADIEAWAGKGETKK